METSEEMKKPAGRIFVGGLIEGINYPKGTKIQLLILRGAMTLS
jgi:hypothetical protein